MVQHELITPENVLETMGNQKMPLKIDLLFKAHTACCVARSQKTLL